MRLKLMAAAIAATCLSATAEAGIVYSTLNTIQFKARANVINGFAGDTTGNTLNVGDGLEGVFITNDLTANGVSQTPPTPELSGVFDLTVAFVIAKTAVAADGIAVGDELTNAQLETYTGEAFVLFRSTNVGGGEGRLGASTAGTAIALYEGGADTLSVLNDGTKDADDVFAAASDGTMIGEFGFGGKGDGLDATDYDDTQDWGADDNGYWYANVEYFGGATDADLDFYYGLEALAGPIAVTGGGPNDLDNSKLPSTSSIPTAATMIEENRSPSKGGTIGFHFVGKGTQELNSGTGNSGPDKAKFSLFINDPASVYPNPEPGSIALALLGAGFLAPAARRRRKDLGV